MCIISRLLEFTYVCMYGRVFEKMYALLASVSRTQLITSWVGNRLLPYVKIQKRTVQIHSPFNILTLPNWLTI